MRETLTRERLVELLEFDETISRFRWKERPGDAAFNAHFGKKLAGSRINVRMTRLAYRSIGIGKTKYQEHRLVWMYYYGQLPGQELDHINGDGLDNRLENLRLASGRINRCNSAMRADNTSGCTGVCWYKSRQKWIVQVQYEGVNHFGGDFKKEDLPLARAKATEMRKALGFSPTHGLTRDERKRARPHKQLRMNTNEHNLSRDLHDRGGCGRSQSGCGIDRLDHAKRESNL